MEQVPSYNPEVSQSEEIQRAQEARQAVLAGQKWANEHPVILPPEVEADPNYLLHALRQAATGGGENGE